MRASPEQQKAIGNQELKKYIKYLQD